VVALVFAQLVGFAMVTSAASTAYLGGTASTRAAIARVRALLGGLVWLAFLMAIRLGALFLAAVIGIVGLASLAQASAGRLGPLGPALGGFAAFGIFVLAFAVGTFLMLRYSLAVAVQVNEPVTASTALQRSIALVRGHLGRAFVICVFGGVIGQIAGLVLQGPFVVGAEVAGRGTSLGLALTIVGAVTGAFTAAVASPLTTAALVVLYFEARVRHEAFDLERLLDALESSAGFPGPVSSPTVAG